MKRTKIFYLNGRRINEVAGCYVDTKYVCPNETLLKNQNVGTYCCKCDDVYQDVHYKNLLLDYHAADDLIATLQNNCESCGRRVCVDETRRFYVDGVLHHQHRCDLPIYKCPVFNLALENVSEHRVSRRAKKIEMWTNNLASAWVMDIKAVCHNCVIKNKTR